MYIMCIYDTVIWILRFVKQNTNPVWIRILIAITARPNLKAYAHTCTIEVAKEFFLFSSGSF